MHGKQHHRPHHVRPDSQRYRHPIRGRSPQIRQLARHVLLFRAGNHPLRGTTPHGSRTGLDHPASDHAIPILPLSNGYCRPLRHILPLPPEVFKVNRRRRVKFAGGELQVTGYICLRQVASYTLSYQRIFQFSFSS